jgi:hypothetical protein
LAYLRLGGKHPVYHQLGGKHPVYHQLGGKPGFVHLIHPQKSEHFCLLSRPLKSCLHLGRIFSSMTITVTYAPVQMYRCGLEKTINDLSTGVPVYRSDETDETEIEIWSCFKSRLVRFKTTGILSHDLEFLALAAVYPDHRVGETARGSRCGRPLRPRALFLDGAFLQTVATHLQVCGEYVCFDNVRVPLV